MKLILASASTARRSMLENAGYRFETVPSTVDETPIKEQADQLGMKMSDLALRLALAKAQDIAALQPNACVIGSDQVLECEGNRFSKVSDLSQAHEQLARLQGKSHHLHSAVAVCCDDRILFQHVETAQLDMWPMSDRKLMNTCKIQVLSCLVRLDVTRSKEKASVCSREYQETNSP
jgi:septum formation protein